MISKLELTKMIYTCLTVMVISLVGCRAASDASNEGDSCATFDLCTSDELFRTCSCTSDCHKYSTCCVDADSYPLMASQISHYVCQSERTSTSVYAKRSCLDVYRGDYAYRNICLESEPDRADVLGNVLVTSLKTKTTYWNMACGMCNNESDRDLTAWMVEVSCPLGHGKHTITQQYVEKFLKFDQDAGEWGLDDRDGFVVCSISFFQPWRVSGQLSYCAPNLVSKCPVDYLDHGVAVKCSAYHAERKQRGSNVYFRNVHCALCNGVSEDDLECVGRNYGRVDLKDNKNFVKVTFESGDWLEREESIEKYKCSSYFSYDPFLKRCRKDPKYFKNQNVQHEANDSARLTFGSGVFFILAQCFFFNKYVF